MRQMYHPDYGWKPYEPWSDERKAAASALHLARLGVPPGYRRVYGHLVPEEFAFDVQKVSREAQRKYGKIIRMALMWRWRRGLWKNLPTLPLDNVKDKV